jgi:chromatin modification-related protein EAF6
VSLTPATRNQELSAGQLKRERDREYQRKKRAMNSKRAPSVMSVDEEAVVPKRTTKRQRMQDEGMSVD